MTTSFGNSPVNRTHAQSVHPTADEVAPMTWRRLATRLRRPLGLFVSSLVVAALAAPSPSDAAQQAAGGESAAA